MPNLVSLLDFGHNLPGVWELLIRPVEFGLAIIGIGDIVHRRHVAILGGEPTLRYPSL